MVHHIKFYYHHYLLYILIILLTACSGGSSYSVDTNDSLITISPLEDENSSQETTSPVETPVSSNQKNIYGVTIDTLKHLDETVEALKSLPKRMTVRLVFDKVAASTYTDAIEKLAPHADIMGELCDSEYIKAYDLEAYKERINAYFDAFGDKVAIWEIGNEVNGEWTYDHESETPDTVAEKTIAAYTEAKKRGYQTALTLSYNDYAENDGCYKLETEKMRDWAAQRLPTEMREGIDYLFVSYYEEDCDGHSPTAEEWNTLFDDMGRLFPHAKLGMGEVGATTGNKAGYLSRYYHPTQGITHDRFVGGYFWWYFVEDMVPKTKPLYKTLTDTLLGVKKSYPPDTTLVDGDLVALGYELDDTLSRPDYRKSIHESGLYTTKITRVTNATGDDSKSPVHHYPKDPVWNADQSLMLLQENRIVVDSSSYDPILTYPGSSSHKKRLSHRNKDIRYGINEDKGNFFIVEEHLRSHRHKILYALSDTYDRVTIGEAEGEMDYQDRYLLLTAHRKGRDDRLATLILYRFESNTTVVKDLDGTHNTQPLLISKKVVKNKLNGATVSPLGRYVLINHYDDKDGTDGRWTKKIEKYDLDLNFIETLAYKGGHGDVCLSQDGDTEYYVQFETAGIAADNAYDDPTRGIWEYNIETKQRDLIAKNHGGGHISCQNYQRPGWAYITYNSIKNPDERDIFSIMLGSDGVDSQGNRVVNRFAKARFMAKNNPGYGYYDQSSHLTPSPDGTKVIFKSNWREGEILDDFVVERAEE